MPQMSPISYGLVPPSGAQVSKAVYNFILSLSVQDYSVFNSKYTTLHLQRLMKLWNLTSQSVLAKSSTQNNTAISIPHRAMQGEMGHLACN